MLTQAKTLEVMEEALQMKLLVQKQMVDWFLEAGMNPNLTSAGITYRRCGKPPFDIRAWFCFENRDSGIQVVWSSTRAEVYAGNSSGSKRRCQATGPTVVEALKTLISDPNFPNKFRK